MTELSFHLLRTLAGKKSIADVPCPECAPKARTPSGRKRACLRIYDDGGDFITFTCGRCGTKGFAKPDSAVNATPAKIDKAPEVKQDRAPVCNLLWDKSIPAIGSLAKVYLDSRLCWPQPTCPQVRFLPASGRYPPTMIIRFGFPGEPLTGVHLTKLADDGRGKAGTDTDKLTMGDTVGQPLVVNVSASDALVIAEGFEDTATLTNATGWNGWAAGTANRIPAVVATAVKRGFKKIYVAKDSDVLHDPSKGQRLEQGRVVFGREPASKRALEQAQAIAPVIPLAFGGLVLGMADNLDANKMWILYGRDVLMAAIRWCEIQDEYLREIAKGNLGCFHYFDRQRTPLRKILSVAT